MNPIAEKSKTEFLLSLLFANVNVKSTTGGTQVVSGSSGVVAASAEISKSKSRFLLGLLFPNAKVKAT